MQIEILGRIAITMKKKINKCWCGCRKRRTLIHCWGECDAVDNIEYGSSSTKVLKKKSKLS